MEINAIINVLQNDSIQILLAFIGFHLVLISFVRTFSLSFYKNISDKLVMKKEKLEQLKKDADTKKAYDRIIAYRSWEGGIMFFATTFWLFSIFMGLLHTTKELFPNKGFADTHDAPFQLAFYFVGIIYFGIVIYMTLRQKKYLVRERALYGTTLIMFFLIPMIIFVLVHELSLFFIFLLWLLSTVYLAWWVILLGYYAPLTSLNTIIGWKAESNDNGN